MGEDSGVQYRSKMASAIGRHGSTLRQFIFLMIIHKKVPGC